MTTTANLNLNLNLEQALLAQVCASGEVATQFAGAAPAELVQLLLAVGAVQRRVDAIVTTVTGQVLDRDYRLAADQVSPKAGCRNTMELLRRTLRVDNGTARRYVTAAGGVHRDVQYSSGEALPARYEALGGVLRDGEVSVTGLLAAIGPLEAAIGRIGAATSRSSRSAPARGSSTPCNDGRST